MNQFGQSENNNNHKDQTNLEDESATILINEDVNEFENESEAKQLRMQQQAIELKINNEPKMMMMMMNEHAKRQQQQQQQQQQNHHHQQQIPIVNSAYFNDDVNFQQQQFRQPSYKNLMQANASSMYPLNKITSNNNLANQSMPSNQFSVNLQQKSLSIGNLANLNPKVGLGAANSPTVSHQISNVNLVKASPSLDLNSKQAKLANTGNSNVISSDHSGDNDSGISSMSSETTTMTTTTTTNSSSSSSTSSSSALPGNGIQAGSIPINFVQSMKPQSMHNINSNYNSQMQQFQQRQQQMYMSGNGNPLLINSLQNQQQQYQYQLQLQQQQQHQQMNTANSANKPTKSVLETLV